MLAARNFTGTSHSEGLRVGAPSYRMRKTTYFMHELRKRQSEFFGRNADS